MESPFGRRFADVGFAVKRKVCSVLCRPGDDLLSHVLRQSTIGAKAFDGRVRDGIGSDRLARATRPAKNGVGRRRTDDRRTSRGGYRPSSVVRSLSSDPTKQNWFLDDRRTETEDRRSVL